MVGVLLLAYSSRWPIEICYLLFSIELSESIWFAVLNRDVAGRSRGHGCSIWSYSHLLILTGPAYHSTA
jgi:hypothetical protein